MAKVTWEVIMEIPTGWCAIYTCEDVDFITSFNNAYKVMQQWKELYPEKEWEMRNERTSKNKAVI